MDDFYYCLASSIALTAFCNSEMLRKEEKASSTLWTGAAVQRCSTTMYCSTCSLQRLEHTTDQLFLAPPKYFAKYVELSLCLHNKKVINSIMLRSCSRISRVGFTQVTCRSLSDANPFGHFYKVSDINSTDDKKRPVVGEVVDKTVDLTKLRPGDKIDLPYELTINHSFRDFWQSAFYSHDRINTSTPFARNMGLQDQVIPFSLMLFLAGSMSHADHAKLQIGFGVGVYHWPAFAGDTFRKRFVIKSLRPTSDGQNTILKVGCEIHNQRDMKLFSCEKYVSSMHIFDFETWN